tara:strand:+ start:254 stop:433 length:180 start_codon:yes stop_codon:yes gene_type:complete|eukprot:scaffold83476_cov57-Phaeocystis_antarctica.AAC.1
MSAYFMFAERSYRTTRRSRTGLCLKSEEKHLFTILAAADPSHTLETDTGKQRQRAHRLY